MKLCFENRNQLQAMLQKKQLLKHLRARKAKQICINTYMKYRIYFFTQKVIFHIFYIKKIIALFESIFKKYLCLILEYLNQDYIFLKYPVIFFYENKTQNHHKIYLIIVMYFYSFNKQTQI